MERDFMGLNSKETVVKEDALKGCKEPDGFEYFNNQQECEIKSYFMLRGAHLLQLHHDTKQASPMFMNSPFFRPVFWGAPINSQLLKGIPFTSHPVIPWYSSKVASAPAPLTIFYDGMVNVYDGISPEKAQAIMFLAGNGAFVATVNASQAQGPTPMTPISTQPCSPALSPMNVSSHLVGQSANKNESAKRVMTSLGPAMQSAIPQARKASLARFLEKRKERVMASAPYKNSMDSATNSNAVVVARE